MPVVQLTERDMNMGRVIEPAWYRVRIDSIGEKPSKDGGSTNFPVDGTILFNGDTGDQTFAGATLTWNFNSKALGFVRGFLECFGVKVEAGKNIELAAAAGSMIDVFVENDEYQGRTVNRVNHKYRVPKPEVTAA